MSINIVEKDDGNYLKVDVKARFVGIPEERLSFFRRGKKMEAMMNCKSVVELLGDLNTILLRIDEDEVSPSAKATVDYVRDLISGAEKVIRESARKYEK